MVKLDLRSALPLLAPLIVVCAVLAMLPSLPNADYWSRFAAPYFLAEDRWQGLQAMLWAADNGHRKPLGQLPYLLNFYLFSGSNYGLFAITAGFALATAAFLIKAVRVARGFARRSDIPLVFCLVLSPAAIFHWVSPMSGTHWLFADALFAASLWALGSYVANPRGRYAIAACATAILAALALTTGLAALLLISIGLLIAAPRKRRMAVALALVNAIFYLGYFVLVFGFAGRIPAEPDLARAAAFFLSAAGNHFSAKPFGIGPSVLMGVALIIAWGWIVQRLAAGAVHSRPRGPLLLAGLLGTYALINLALIAFGRHEMALTVSLTTRYGNVASLLMLAVLLGWLELSPGRGRRWPTWALFAVLIGAGYLKGIAELAFYHRGYIVQAPLDRIALLLDLPAQIRRKNTYVRFPTAPGLTGALRRAGHVPFSPYDRPIPLGVPFPDRPGVAVEPTSTNSLPGGWARIVFRAPQLPDVVDLADAQTRHVVGAAVRVGDRHIGYARIGSAPLLALPEPNRV